MTFKYLHRKAEAKDKNLPLKAKSKTNYIILCLSTGQRQAQVQALTSLIIGTIYELPTFNEFTICLQECSYTSVLTFPSLDLLPY